MEDFVVSARKYRPVGFEEVVGQEHITTTLQNAIDNSQLAQALLFCGPRGVGKTTCARIVARMINDQAIDNPLMANDTFNIYELDAASNNSVDDIRNLIDQVRYPPQQGKFKVYIIDEVHMLSNQAFNAFLKTLEEPPPYAIFILATTEKHKVIPTILSRCQIFDFNRIEVKDISFQLEKIAQNEGVATEAEALHLIAQKADGAMRDALSFFDLIVTFSHGKKVTYATTIENLHILDYDYYFRMCTALFEENTSETLLIFDEILKKGFDGHNFIVGLAGHFRDLMVCKDAATIGLLEVSDGIKVKYKEQSEAIPLSFLLTALNIASQCDINYKGSKNQRLHVELALVKMAHLNSAISLARMDSNGGNPSKKKNLAKTNSKEGTEATISTRKPVATSAPEAVPKPVEKKPTKASPKTFSIPKLDALKQEINKPGKEFDAKDEAEAQPMVSARQNAFDEDQLKLAWKGYMAEIEAAGRHQELVILKEPFELAGTDITLNIANEALVPSFEKVKADLLAALRNGLGNDSISLNAKVVEVEPSKMLYTDHEKFEHLKRKYPALKELQEKLGLDPDF